MNTQENIPVCNCLALTVKKDYKLMVIKKATKTTLRVSWKTLLYVALLTIANIFI